MQLPGSIPGIAASSCSACPKNMLTPTSIPASSIAAGSIGLPANPAFTAAAPRGVGPYGITVTPKGAVWYASLAGNYIARIDPASGQATVVEPSTPKQGARRVWSDSRSRLWVSEWNSGNVSLHDPADGSWKAWKLPGTSPRAYAVYVDDKDKVWLTDFSGNAIVRFDPLTEKFSVFASDRAGANVRQLDGRAGEIWGAESGTDRLVVIATAAPV
jgi:virginiamycin B lyase